MKTGQKLAPLSLLLITLIIASASCMRQEGSAVVTVDTLETDFFDDLKTANALKTYVGVLSGLDSDSIYTELTIHEDSLTYRLSEKHIGDDNRADTLFTTGTFVRNTLQNGQARLQLIADSIGFKSYFEASGDTLLYKLLPDGEARVEGLQITLVRK